MTWKKLFMVFAMSAVSAGTLTAQASGAKDGTANTKIADGVDNGKTADDEEWVTDPDDPTKKKKVKKKKKAEAADEAAKAKPAK